MFSQLLKKKIIFISGKGGTGKSVMSAVLGLLAAQQGKRVLLAESQVFDKLSPLFGYGAIGHNEVQVAERVSCIKLDAKRCFAEYVMLHLGMEQLYDRVFRNGLVTSLLDAIPGLDETMILGRLFHTCELSSSQKYDLVIFDGPASGHFLNLMATPETIIQSGLVGPLVREVGRVQAFLKDSSKSAGVIVTLPEALVMNETFEFLPIFAEKVPVPLAAIILNRAYVYESGNFPPAIQAYFDRKQAETQRSREDLVDLLRKTRFCDKVYTFPDIQVVPEPLKPQSVYDIAPLIEGMDFAAELT